MQALATLNNVVYVEASRGMARLALTAAEPGDAQRIALMFRRSVARPPSASEASPLAACRRWYAVHEAEARALVAGDHQENVPVAEAAAWTAVAGVIMNLDEFITRE